VRVLVYVEGPSDRAALETLLKSVLNDARQNGVGIQFLPQQGKAAILKHSGMKAADHLSEHPEDWVFALPDLHPMAQYDGTDDEHRTFDQLAQVIRARFEARARKVGLDESVYPRFRVHCLKHDLEALLLAVPELLRQRLGTKDALKGHWRIPVEDQNGEKPPKRIVEELFKKYRPRPGYVETADAPWILGKASLDDIEKACRQRFAPFATELKSIATDKRLP